MPFAVGHHCVIADDVEIGDGTVIRNYVEIREGVKIGSNCYIDSRVSFSGDCTIGDNVTLRYGVIVAKGAVIGDGSYICPRVMFNNLDTSQKPIGGAHVGANCFVGTHAVLGHGIRISDGTVIGAMAFVTKDADGGTWVGIPAEPLDSGL